MLWIYLWGLLWQYPVEQTHLTGHPHSQPPAFHQVYILASQSPQLGQEYPTTAAGSIGHQIADNIDNRKIFISKIFDDNLFGEEKNTILLTITCLFTRTLLTPSLLSRQLKTLHKVIWSAVFVSRIFFHSLTHFSPNLNSLLQLFPPTHLLAGVSRLGIRGGRFTTKLVLESAPRGIPFCDTYRFQKYKF